MRVASASACARRSRASASRIAASRRPSAASTIAARSPSARTTVARRSRSAVICRFMARTRLSGGSTLRSSTRLTFTPQGSVAPSRMVSSEELMRSRPLSVASRSISPITLRMLVIVSAVSAASRCCTW